MILISLAPLLIFAVVVTLFFKEPVLLLVPIAVLLAIILVATQRQKSVSRRLYSSSTEDWMSRTCFYVGPFDGSGLPGAASFERQHSRNGHPPQVRLVLSNNALAFGPAGHSGSSLDIPFSSIHLVDLYEGSHPHKLLITPPVAAQRGQVVVTTTQGHTAKVSGIPIEGIQTALRDRGATIEVVGN